jgi:hypothetical protein
MYPRDCVSLAATLMDKILPAWDPRNRRDPVTDENNPGRG